MIWLIELMLEQPSEIVQRAISEISELTRVALAEMRSLIMQLRPIGLEQGLLAALSDYGKAIGFMVHSGSVGTDRMPKVNGQVEEALFRIGQEAINNARKYAGERQVQINLKVQRSRVILENLPDPHFIFGADRGRPWEDPERLM